MKFYGMLIVFLAFISCKEEKSNITKYEEFVRQCDTTINSDSSFYRIIVDTLAKKLPNYLKQEYSKDTLNLKKQTSFSMVPCAACSQMYMVRIELFKNNKAAFQYFIDLTTRFIGDTIQSNKFKEFNDVIMKYKNHHKLIYFNNIVIDMSCQTQNGEDQNINMLCKKLLINKNYKEVEFYDNCVFWTSK